MTILRLWFNTIAVIKRWNANLYVKLRVSLSTRLLKWDCILAAFDCHCSHCAEWKKTLVVFFYYSFHYVLLTSKFWDRISYSDTVNQQKITNNWRKVCLQTCLYVCNLADVAAGMAGLKTSVYDQVAFQLHFVDISVQKLKDSLIIWEDMLYRRLLQWVQVTSVLQMAHDTTKRGDQSRPLRLRWILHRAQPYVRPNWTLWQAAGFCMLHIKKLKYKYVVCTTWSLKKKKRGNNSCPQSLLRTFLGLGFYQVNGCY